MNNTESQTIGYFVWTTFGMRKNVSSLQPYQLLLQPNIVAADCTLMALSPDDIRPKIAIAGSGCQQCASFSLNQGK